MTAESLGFGWLVALAPLWSLPGLLVLGCVVGSFVNVVVRRLPLMMERRWWLDAAAQFQGDSAQPPPVALEPSWRPMAQALEQRLRALPRLDLQQPGSHCPSCGHRLRWKELIPVLSWLWLRGRCSACGTPLAVRMLGVELGCGLLFMAMGWRWDWQPVALIWAAWGAALVALALIDWDTLLLPDSLTLGLVWAGLAVAWWGWTIPLPDAVAGAIAGYLSLWAVAAAFERLTGRVGMGEGDFKLLAALGAWLGPALLVAVVLVASLSGLLAGLVMKHRGTLREGEFVPFGPFLVAGGLIVLGWMR